MKYIFLDVDGVLNSNDSEDRYHCYVGLDESGIMLLKEIVDKTGSEIILVSSWKSQLVHNPDDWLGKYLVDRLKEHSLTIKDTTYNYEPDSIHRGTGIINYLKEHPASKWIILDDEIFPDYEKTDCLKHLIKTSFYDGGLKQCHVDTAIKILNGDSVK